MMHIAEKMKHFAFFFFRYQIYTSCFQELMLPDEIFKLQNKIILISFSLEYCTLTKSTIFQYQDLHILKNLKILCCKRNSPINYTRLEKMLHKFSNV